VAAVDLRDPIDRRMRGERLQGAEIGWIGVSVLQLRGPGERKQQRGGGEIGDAEAGADELAARLELGRDPVERRAQRRTPGSVPKIGTPSSSRP
jgi:hypothetical protein